MASLIKKLSVAFCSAAMLLMASSALSQDESPHDHVWSIRNVGHGCTAIFHDSSLGTWDDSDETIMGTISSIEWIGSCNANGLIDGKGTIVISYRSSSSEARGFLEVSATNGILNGPEHGRREERFGSNEPWEAVQNGEVAGNWTSKNVNGCLVDEMPPPCYPNEGVAKRNEYLAAHASAAPQNSAFAGAAPSLSSSGSAASGAAVSGATGDVFNKCMKLESLGRPGIQMIWQLTNVCNARVQIAYCFKSKFPGAGDKNLCMHSEHRNAAIAPGDNLEFAYTLGEDGTFMSDGRMVQDDALEVVGHACANGNSPGTRFDNKEFVFTGC